MANVSPADVLRQFFRDQGAAVSPTSSYTMNDWPIVTGPMPTSQQDNFLAVQNAGGVVQGRLQKPGSRVFRPSVNVGLRSVDEPTGWDKARALESLIDRIGTDVDKGGLWWVTVHVASQTYTLKSALILSPFQRTGAEETNRRQVYTMTVMLTLVQEL